jgi:DNA-binding GntR family transcriptional regulator
LKLYYFLEERLNIKIVSSQEDIMAQMPTREAVRFLNIKSKSLPLLVRKMLIYDEKGEKIAYSIGYYLSNRFVLNLEISR